MRWPLLVIALVGCREAKQPAPVPTSSTEKANPHVSLERYSRELAFIAQPRPPGSAHWKAVQDRCATVFEAAGLTVRREAYATGVNVVGERRGSERPDELVVIGAHYDSTERCAGADDNASGVAGVLEAARVLGATPHARTLVVVCWDEEERGLIGSRAHATTLQNAGRSVVIAYDFETIGFRSTAPRSQSLPPGAELLFPDVVRELDRRERRGDFIALVHDGGARAAAARIVEQGRAIELPALALELPDALRTSPAAGDLFRSDHASFWSIGVPAIMITDTANFRNARYHCSGGPDELETLDLPFAARVVTAVVGAAATDLDAR